jgi:hypothetical protein
MKYLGLVLWLMVSVLGGGRFFLAGYHVIYVLHDRGPLGVRGRHFYREFDVALHD